MRIRKKPNLIPRMERCAHVQIFDPEHLRGQWKTTFPGYKQLHVDLGAARVVSPQTRRSPPRMFV